MVVMINAHVAFSLLKVRQLVVAHRANERISSFFNFSSNKLY